MHWHVRYSGGGKQPYHPALLLSLLFYGYATGVFSSRKLEQATYDSVAFRYITALHTRTTTRLRPLRKRFLSELTDLFAQVLVMAQAMGLLQLGKVSLDGTKIKANASKHKAMSWAASANNPSGFPTSNCGQTRNGTVCAGGTGGYRGLQPSLDSDQ